MVYGKHETQRYTYGLDMLAVDVTQNLDSGVVLPNSRQLSGKPKPSERAYFLHNDLGSPIRLVDESGKSKAVYSYDAFGRPIMAATPMGMGGKKTPGAGSNIFSYTGYQHDSSGLMFAQARYYLPEMGRFMSEDPSKDGENWYIRCINNPINYLDSDGNVLQIVGTSAYKNTVFNQLKSLTRDCLKMDSNGIISIVPTHRSKNKDSGTQLLRELVKNKRTATIKYQGATCCENADDD
jgi:RHS repeat-associated protein